ncbi:proximal tubules-expressed gene protein-like [Xenopus laevis]|nr:proximal tubules-expressed gene protein-like [Xenopus laevis]
MFSLQYVLLILISLGQVYSQQVHHNTGRRFPQWLTGLIAMTVFLFLVLVVFVAKRLWNKRTQEKTNMKDFEEVVANGTSESYEARKENIRSSEHFHAYENPIEVDDNIRTTAM